MLSVGPARYEAECLSLRPLPAQTGQKSAPGSELIQDIPDTCPQTLRTTAWPSTKQVGLRRISSSWW